MTTKPTYRTTKTRMTTTYNHKVNGRAKAPGSQNLALMLLWTQLQGLPQPCSIQVCSLVNSSNTNPLYYLLSSALISSLFCLRDLTSASLFSSTAPIMSNLSKPHRSNNSVWSSSELRLLLSMSRIVVANSATERPNGCWKWRCEFEQHQNAVDHQQINFPMKSIMK